MLNDRDGLYIDHVRVDTLGNTSITFQGNDLTKPNTLQTSFSGSFTLVDNVATRRLTQSAEQLDSGSSFAYRPLPAYLIERGEIIFSGFVELSEFSGGWQAALYEEKLSLFDRLDRSLRTLDLSAFDHPWSPDSMRARATSAEGVCYPLIDYGLLREDKLPLDTIFPAVYVLTLLRQMLREEGYTLAGALPSDELLKRLIIPFSESEPTSRDEAWRDDRFAKVSHNRPDDQVSRNAISSSNFIDRTQPFDVDNLPEQGIYQGKLHNYQTGTYSYVCDSSMNLRIETYQTFRAITVTGSVEIILTVEKNGQQVGASRFDTGSGYNVLGARVDTISLDTTVKCQPGDQIRIHLVARRRTATGRYSITIFNNADNCGASFTPSLTTALGDNWPVARNLPDRSCNDLLLTIGFLMNGSWSIDRFRREVRFLPLTDTLNNVAAAVDWSSRIDTGQEPRWQPQLSPYGQYNRLQWAEQDETKQAGRVLPYSKKMLAYGDGVIETRAGKLALEATIFDLPFAASTPSEQSLSGYGNPVLIKTRTVSGSGANQTINQQGTGPRLLLVAPELSYPVQSVQVAEDNETLVPISVPLKPCWFGPRPDIAVSRDTNFCLSFDRLPLGRSEQPLIERYYVGLRRVLRRMRVLTLTMLLRTSDVAGLDFARPVRLGRVSVGSLVLSDGLYYLNKISDYRAGETCQVTLIAYD